MLRIKRLKLVEEQIVGYFTDNSSIFNPSIESRISLNEFSRKIFLNAIQFGAYWDKTLVGFLACYFNHPQKEFGFITTISVNSEFQNKGIANKLMNKAIKFGQRNEFKKIVLEADKDNKPAITFYQKVGFKETKRIDQCLLFELVL